MKVPLGIALALHAAFLAGGAWWTRPAPAGAPPPAPDVADEIAIEPPRRPTPPDAPRPAEPRPLPPAKPGIAPTPTRARGGGRAASPAARIQPGAPPRGAAGVLAAAHDTPRPGWTAPSGPAGDASGGDVSEGGGVSSGVAAGTGTRPAAPGGTGEGHGGDAGQGRRRRPLGLGERWDAVGGPGASDLPAQAAEADERTLPSPTIARVVGRSAGRLRACYDDGLRREPDLAGRMILRYLVGGGGDVLVAVDADTTIADPAVVRCVLATFAAMVFPRQEGSAPVWSTYQVAFPPG